MSQCHTLSISLIITLNIILNIGLIIALNVTLNITLDQHIGYRTLTKGTLLFSIRTIYLFTCFRSHRCIMHSMKTDYILHM